MTIRRVRVGEILQLERTAIQVSPDDTYRRIGIYSWGKGIIRREATPGAEMGSLRYFNFPADSLILSNIQAWESAVAVATAADARDFVCSNRFLPYTEIAPGTVSSRYLLHYFLSERGAAALRGASPGTQVRNRTLGKKLFEALEVPFPSLAEQRRIADHLDAVAHANSRPHPSRSHLRRLKQRVIHTIPASPEQLANLLSPREPVPVSGTDSYRITGVYSFGKGLLDRGAISGADTKYKTLTRLNENDLVYSKLGAFEGAVAVVPPPFAGTFVSPEFPVFEVNKRLNPRYLHHVVSSPAFEDLLSSSTVGVGARQKRVSPATFLTLPFGLPSPNEQQRIIGVLDRFDAAWELIERSTRLTQSLLPAARNEVFNALR